MSSHWNGRQRWASAANSHAHAHAHTPAQTSVASSSSAHARRQRAAEQRRQHTGSTASAGGRRLDLIREDCDLAGPAAAVTPPPPPKAPAGTSPGSTAASSSIASLTSPLASTPTSTTGAAGAAGSPPASASASASARSRIHERRISALRQSGHHAAADILERAVWKANNNNGNNSDVVTGTNITIHDNDWDNGNAQSNAVLEAGGIGDAGEYGHENDGQDMMMAEMTATETENADDASVLTFATEATNTTPQLNDSDATDVHANACVHDALVTPEKTRPATRNVHGDGETASTANNTPGTPDTVPIVSATSSPAGGSEAEAHREGWVAPEDAEVGARALADAEAERLAKEEERTAREEKEKARRQRAEEAMHLAMAAAEAKVEAERIAAEEQRRRKAGAEAAAAAAASTERSERIAAVEAQSMLLEQRRPSLSAVSAGTNELVSDNDHNDQDDGSSGKAETEEKASNTSGSDCPLNYSMSSDGDNGQLPSELSSPVHVESPSVLDGANNEPDQSSSPPSSTKKKMWGRSVRKSPSQNWGQSARQSKTSPASTTSGTEEGDTDRSFSSRRSIDDAIANLSEKMFSAVSSALPPRHPSTEADHKVAESLPLPDYLPGYYSQKDSDASAAPSLRSVASSATPVAGAGTRDVSSLWDTGVDAPSALSGGATNEENDKLTFGDSGGVELSNLDRFEPEMARDLKLAGDAFRTTLKSRGMEHDATSSIDIEVGSMGEVEVFSPKISGRPTKNNGGKRKKDPFMDCSPSSSSSSRASRTLAKLMPSGCCSWCRRIPCPQKAKPVHALFLLIPIVSVMLYLCYVYFVQPNL